MGPRSIDDEKKVKGWSFTLVSFNHETLRRLHRPPDNEVEYLAYAFRHDDTGKYTVEGYVKMMRRVRVNILTSLFGNGFYKPLHLMKETNTFIRELKVLDGFQEFGKLIITQGYRSDLSKYEDAVKAGLSEEQLRTLFPSVFSRYTYHAMRCLLDRASEEAKETNAKATTVEVK